MANSKMSFISRGELCLTESFQGSTLGQAIKRRAKEDLTVQVDFVSGACRDGRHDRCFVKNCTHPFHKGGR